MKKKIVILGAGESGVGAALLSKQKGYEVFVSDRGKIKEDYQTELRNHKIPYEESKHTKEKIFEATELVKSPGIPDTVPLIKELKKRKTARFDVAIGGNIGYSFARLLTEKERAFYVLELSSFQLDGMYDFRPDVSVLLNITPDHLDRYDYKMKNYIASKFRIIQAQKGKDLFIYNAKDENIRAFLKGKRKRMKSTPVYNIFHQKNKLQVGDAEFNTEKCSLKGLHNMFNATCAIHAAKAVGVEDKFIQEGLNTFVNAPHRLEHVATVNGVEFINDSKATNVDSVYYALAAMEKPVIWMAGGTDKGNDYSDIEKLVLEKVKAIVCLGVDNEKIKKAFRGKIEIIEETQNVKKAIKLSQKHAVQGDVVLLSPACASFDLFKNYTQRGDLFKEAVKSLQTSE